MKDIINGLIERFRRQHVQARRYVAMMLVLALLTTLFVNWQLHGVGISMTADYHCGYEEHQHTAACYEKVLTCGYEEGEPETPVTSSDSSADPVSAYSAEEPEEPVQTEPETIWVPHEHTDACYEEHRVLTCYQEEHEHTDDCFDEYGALICGEFEHIHDDSCYTTEYELVCGLDEGELVEEPNPAYQEMPATRPVVDLPTEPAETTPEEPVLHHHTDACYTEELVCTIPEHHHTVECLADTQADVETAEEWQAAANVALNGNWAEDLLTVAKSQLDYQQSDKNFKLDVEDQQVLRGYSRYGAWYGNPYGAWDVMFLSYCLHFAGVPQTVVPQRAGVMALHSDLRGSQWLTDADGSTARPGDIVIYNTLTTEQVAVDESSYGIALLDLDEDPDTAAQLTASEPQVDTRTVTTETVGVVSAVDPDAGTLTVISGNVDGKVAEVPAAMSDVTSVISVTGAYAAETTAVAPEDPDSAGSQEELDGSYALLEDEDGFGATVDWVGDADPYGIALLAAGDDHDLKTWITDVNYEKTTDGKTWTSIGAGSVTVDSGTRVRVNLKYTVKPGVLTPTNNTLTYQLPKGLPMPDVVTGNIVDESDKDKAGNAKVVGSFTVDTDGTVTLTFTDEKFIGTDEKGGLPFTGTFKAAVTASADNFEDEKEIKFKDDCILTIKKKTADIKINKESGDPTITDRKDGTFVNNYKVTVETTNGTKDPVILTDTLNTNRNGENRSDYLKGGTYLTNSFKLCKVDASGTKTEIDVPTHELKTDGNGNPQVVLAPLPALEAGEKYIWNYDVQRNYADFDNMPNGVAIINNTAKAEAGRNVKDAVDAWYTCKTSRIEKKGQYDPKTGHIQWTITVKVPHSFLGSYLLQGCKITDDLPDGVKIVGDVKVGNDTISAEEFQKNGYTIPAGYDGTELKITFETTTPIGGGSVTNTAQILTKSNHTFEASDTVNIGKGDWSLSKSIATRGETPTWNLSATNKAGEAEFTLWDVLDDAENDQGEEKKDTHYAIAKELDDAIKANLTLTMHDNTKLTYAEAFAAGNTIKMTYYAQKNGTEEVDANNSSIRVRSFTIHVKAGDNQNPVRSISVTGIPTHEKRDDVPTGEVWTYKNFMKIDGVSGNDSAEDTYRSYKKFEKGVAATSSGNETGYLTGNNTFEKNDLGGHKLRYQLVLQTDQDDADAIEVTDILPENVDFAINSVQISLDEDAFVKPDKLTTAKATAAYDPATRQLTVNIKDYNPDANKPHRIRIRYEVDVGTDTQLAWKNPSVSKLTYTNTATWGELTETTTTTVTRKVEQVKKTGWQDSGNDRKLHYQVVINPAHEDLSAGQTKAEKIELWDNISTTNGAIATGDVNSVKLYFYNYDETVGVTTGKEVPRNMYRILEADKNGWLHMEIPNMAAMILVYDCNVKDGSAAANYQVSNTVTLSNGSKSSADSINYQVKADATATTAQFVLRKKDSYSGVSLKGAEFTIYQYDKAIEGWTKWAGNGTGTLTTDENGQASLAVLDSETASCLKPDVLYKLVETKAPTDYQLDATPHYLLFRKNASAENEQQAFAKATGQADGTTTLTVGTETVDLNRNVQVGSDAGTTTAEYSNVYSNLTVSKLWLDQDTKKPVEPAVDRIHIKVWQYTDNDKDRTLFAEADLTAPAWTWSESGDKLPLKDENGNAYHYLVEEETTGNWNVYIDNNGVQTGNITVQNYVYTGYELPSTGGMGTAPFGVLGGALAAAAALLLVRKRKQDEEE